jgi:hypothetical protein
MPIVAKLETHGRGRDIRYIKLGVISNPILMEVTGEYPLGAILLHGLQYL